MRQPARYRGTVDVRYPENRDATAGSGLRPKRPPCPVKGSTTAAPAIAVAAAQAIGRPVRHPGRRAASPGRDGVRTRPAALSAVRPHAAGPWPRPGSVAHAPGGPAREQRERDARQPGDEARRHASGRGVNVGVQTPQAQSRRHRREKDAQGNQPQSPAQPCRGPAQFPALGLEQLERGDVQLDQVVQRRPPASISLATRNPIPNAIVTLLSGCPPIACSTSLMVSCPRLRALSA